MAKISPSISLLLIVVACCWLMGTSAEENIKNPSRTERQYSLNGDYAVPYYAPLLDLPSFSYNTDTRANGYFNRPFFASAPASSGERTFQTLVNLLSGRPLCAACPSCPACPGCPTCPVVPVIPADPISLNPTATKCLTTKTADVADDLTPCSRVSAAPSGIIDVAFTAETTAGQTVAIGIVAVAPNTKITLTCTAVVATAGTNLGAKTQSGAITANAAVTYTGFVQIIASGNVDTDKKQLKCSWKSS